jgi:RNA polymerase sigma-70 factor (ECF subfamily)
MLFRAGEVRHTAPCAEPSLDFESLYRDHFDFVYRSAARIGGPTIDPEDVAQEVFLVVQRRLDSFDRSSQLTTWLYGITLRVARTMRIRTWRRHVRDSQYQPEAPPVEPDRAEVREAHAIAYEILDAMAAKKRDVFILFEFEELTCDEIAVVVGTKVETVWSRLHYARKEFSERLSRRAKRLGLTATAQAALGIASSPVRSPA